MSLLPSVLSRLRHRQHPPRRVPAVEPRATPEQSLATPELATPELATSEQVGTCDTRACDTRAVPCDTRAVKSLATSEQKEVARVPTAGAGPPRRWAGGVGGWRSAGW